jgi:hypothetical protein
MRAWAKRVDLIGDLVAVLAYVACQAVAVWAAARLVSDFRLDGPLYRQLLAAVAGPAAAWAMVLAPGIPALLRGRSRLSSSAPIQGAVGLTAVASFPLGVAASAILGLPLSASGVGSHVFAVLVTLLALLALLPVLAMLDLWPVPTAGWELAATVGGAAGLWLIAGLGDVSIGSGPGWLQALALAVLAQALLLVTVKDTDTETWGSSSGFGHGVISGYSGFVSFSQSSSYSSLTKQTEPFLPNVPTNVLALAAFTWASRYLDVSVEVEGTVTFLVAGLILTAVRTLASRFYPTVYQQG